MTKAETEPFERPLRVFAFDPSRGRSKTNVVTLRLPYEPLEPGPIGRYVAVIDHDTTEDRTYEGVDLGAREAMMSGGLDPSETDVRFHQQMAYAVATRTIQAFEQALGRPIRWPWASGSEPPLPQDKLRIYPHAERVPNAWFLPQTGEMCLGYDVAAGDGAAQLFYTCLSYDIVAHQTVHPLLQSVFPRFADGIDPDTAAFHEGLADLVALLQHFDFDDAVLDAVEGTGGRIWELSTAPDIGPGSAGATVQAQRPDTNPLLEIGRQMAQAEGMGNTIRSVLGSAPDPKTFAAATEPHERGAIMVAAVFDAFFTIYARRTQDLMGIAGAGGRGDRIHPDLTRRLAAEATRVARQFLGICIRALDYCPPVDVGFGDYLRAIVTSDAELVPEDDLGYREALIESFRSRGIPAPGVISYSPEGLRWSRQDDSLPRCEGLRMTERWVGGNVARLRAYAKKHRQRLGLRPRLPIEIDSPSVRYTQRVGPTGQLQRELVVQITQPRRAGGTTVRGGVTLILDESGVPKYVISAPRSASAPPSVPPPPSGPPPRSALAHRPLQIFAFDPTQGRTFGNHLAVSVPFEELQPGPVGAQVAVVDYDASNDRYYDAVDLDEPRILFGGGLAPNDLDPQFHQQMVYAAVANTLERFEIALGRRVVWEWAGRPTPPFGDRLRVHPHAMQEANAYYDRALRALLFGYFTASEDAPGSNLPGQVVYTCLSHDIVVHETTHAILDSLQPYYLERTGPDAAAFHEAFADVIALLRHFSYPEALRDTIQRSGGEIHRMAFAAASDAGPAAARIGAEVTVPNPLVALAQQFGEALGTRAALRSALGTPRDPHALAGVTEAHARGAVFVAAVFDAFFTVYIQRTADLMAVARAGGTITPWNDLRPELADRLSQEAMKAADRLATMCMRAIDYCPPVSIEFGDFLRGLVTADAELDPIDSMGYRAAIVDAFASRGIYPGEVRSLSEDAVRWELADVPDAVRCEGLDPDLSQADVTKKNAILLSGFAHARAKELGLSTKVPVVVKGFHPSTSKKIDAHGNVRPEFHVQIVQRRMEPLDPKDPGGPQFPFRGGTTVVLDETGRVRYLIGKRIEDRERLARQREHLLASASAGAAAAYRGPALRPLSLAALHRGVDG